MPKAFVLLAVVCMAIIGRSQDAVRGTLTMGFGNIADIQQKAELGDANAQVALGDSLASRFHATEELGWYRKAAQQGKVQGQFHVGQMLLFGAVGIPNELSVQANPVEGVRWRFTAATNRHPNASRNVAKALRYGWGKVDWFLLQVRVEKLPCQTSARARKCLRHELQRQSSKRRNRFASRGPIGRG